MSPVPSQQFPSSEFNSTDPESLLAPGDERWARRQPKWRERELALTWPSELLERFCLRMATQGMCVSQVLMQCDRTYALQQLAHAHNMADDALRLMAVELFRHFEARQSGISRLH